MFKNLLNKILSLLNKKQSIDKVQKELTDKYLGNNGVHGVSHNEKHITFYMENLSKNKKNLPTKYNGYKIEFVESGPFYAQV